LPQWIAQRLALQGQRVGQVAHAAAPSGGNSTVS
jgi:hypothetical protein